MKILLNNKYQEVDFWSFTKCMLLSNLAVTGIVYGIIAIFGILLIMAGVD
jgi:hypothetical protein